jgi:hypothetical protein
MTIPTIPLYVGDIPDRNTQDAATFTLNAVTWLDYQLIQIPATNTSIGEINSTAIQVTADADAAAVSAVTAESSANFKGRWVDLTGALNIPASVERNSRVYQLLENLADVTLADPSTSSKWLIISSSEFYASDHGFIGSLAGDQSAAFDAMLLVASVVGARSVIFPIPTDFDIDTTIVNMHDVILSGFATIRTDNADNRYIKCSSENRISQESDFVDIGDMSSFSNAVLNARYGGVNPRVVLLGDSLLMGGQNFNDYSWPASRIETEIRNALGSDGLNCEFFNRAIAGSNIGEVEGIIPGFATPATTHAPGEVAWIDNTGVTWLSYVTALQPDLIVLAFGMNAQSSDDIQDAISLRAALKALPSKPSIIWMSTPMRTVDASKSLGVFPGNEHTNAAGLSYANFGRFVRDTVIDVNRSSNMVMLGRDNYSAAIEAEDENRSVVSIGSTSSIVGGKITAQLVVGGSIRSEEFSRDCAVEFRVTTQGALIRVIGRADTASINSIHIEITPTDINLIGPDRVTGVMGTIATVAATVSGKLVRFQMLGNRVFVALDNVFVINEDQIYGAQFSNNLRVDALTGASDFTNLVFRSGTYKTNVPTLSTDQIFSADPAFGAGGNDLNHPNTIGIEYIYGSALKGFSKKLLTEMANNKTVLSVAFPVLDGAFTSGTMVARRVGNNITVNADALQGTISAGTVIATLDLLYLPTEDLVVSGIFRGTQDRQVSVFIEASTGDIIYKSATAAGDGTYGFTVTYARLN